MSLLAAKKKLLMAQKKGLRVQEVFNTSLWTGTGAARTITTGIDSGEGSLVWIKSRNGDWNNTLFDTARGLNLLWSNTTNAQVSNVNIVTDFVSSGYGLGPNNYGNGSGYTYVGWQFRRAEKFFDIVQYTGNGVSGRQIAHSLGVKPGMIVVKRLEDSDSNWIVYHQSQAATKTGYLNLTGAFLTTATPWANTEPTDLAFTVGGNVQANASGGTYIAYLFAHDPSPEGVIQCGSYVGNGSTTGPVVNLGWRPQYLTIKAATTSASWYVFDNLRGVAPIDAYLSPNLSSAENSSSNVFEYLSDGFQIRSSSGAFNNNGDTYIYTAIREAA
jgi:hypothetical protein